MRRALGFKADGVGFCVFGLGYEKKLVPQTSKAPK